MIQFQQFQQIDTLFLTTNELQLRTMDVKSGWSSNLNWEQHIYYWFCLIKLSLVIQGMLQLTTDVSWQTSKFKFELRMQKITSSAIIFSRRTKDIYNDPSSSHFMYFKSIQIVRLRKIRLERNIQQEIQALVWLELVIVPLDLNSSNSFKITVLIKVTSICCYDLLKV